MPHSQLQDSPINREIAELGAKKWAEALRGSMTLNGAGAGVVAALIQAGSPGSVWLHLAATPFVAGLLCALGGSLFTFTSPLEPIETKFEHAERVGKATLLCMALFVVGVVLTFSMSLGNSLHR